jgi:WXG100 family type VII secretion target
MADEIFMDVPEMRKLAEKFSGMSDNLKAVAKSMEAQLLVLRTAAFTGMVGAEAYRQWLEQMKPRVERFADRCTVTKTSLGMITDAYEQGDMQGAAAFAATE